MQQTHDTQEVLDTVQDMLMGQVQVPLEPESAKAQEKVDQVCSSESHQPSHAISTVIQHPMHCEYKQAFGMGGARGRR